MADQQQLFRHGALDAWYETAKAALYLNRTLRDWLELYAPPHRPEAAKLALIYGITCLRKSYGSQVLNLEELRAVIGQGQHTVALQEELPSVHEEVAQIRQLLDSLDPGVSTANTVDSW